MAKEADIQKAILAWLKFKGYKVWRNYVGPVLRAGKFSPNPMAGMPDICGILKSHPGKFFAIEVKKPGGKVSPKQVKWIAELNKAGAVAFVAQDLDTVKKILKEYEELLSFVQENAQQRLAEDSQKS